LIRHAVTNVPFYREWAKQERITVGDLNHRSDLTAFPVLRKDKIRANVQALLSESAAATGKLIKLQTSGTTGSPLDIYCSREERIHHYAFFSRLRWWFGLKPRSRRATFLGRIIMLPEHRHPPFWRHDIAQNNLIMSAYHLSEENLIHY